jgi:hypothetical protein
MPFHDRYNTRQFGMIYDSRDAGLKAQTSREEFLTFGEACTGSSGASRRPRQRVST